MTQTISQNTQNTKLEATLEPEMNAEHDENPLNRTSQNGKAKSPKAQMACRIARLVRSVGLDYEGWRLSAVKFAASATPPAQEAKEAPPCPEP